MDVEDLEELSQGGSGGRVVSEPEAFGRFPPRHERDGRAGLVMSRLRRRALLGPHTSRRNKLALIASYRAEGEDVTWGWMGAPFESRLMVWIDGEVGKLCLSYDEDIRPKLKGDGL